MEKPTAAVRACLVPSPLEARRVSALGESEARRSSARRDQPEPGHLRTTAGRPIAATARTESVIATYLDRETAKIDHLVATVEEAIDRLQEYRAALITAAVTGTIDVRGEAASPYAVDPPLARVAERVEVGGGEAPMSAEAAARRTSRVACATTRVDVSNGTGLQLRHEPRRC